MRLRNIIASTALSAVIAGPATGADIALAVIEAYTARALEDFDVTGLAITVVKKDSVVFQNVYGVRDVETGLAVDENTIFPFASVSKAFTTAAIAMAVDEGKLNWDDPVRDFIPEFEMSDPYITAEFSVRDLVTHRSGLPLGAGDLLVIPDAKPAVSDILTAIKHIKPATSFRSRYAYDNLLYIVAGEVLSRVDERPWHISLSERLFKPLGMSSCEALPSKAAAANNTVTQHSRAPGQTETKPIDPRYILGDSASPAGGLSCSVMDFAKWAQFWLNDGVTPSGERLISERQIKELWTGVTPQDVNPMLKNLGGANFSIYGLGWSLRDFHGEFFVGHSGGLLGASAYFGLLPEKDFGVFVASNVSTPAASALALQILNDAAAPNSGSDWIGQLNQLYTRMQEIARKDASVDQTDADVAIEPVRSLNDYVGSYVDPWYGRVAIEIRDGALYIDMSRSEVLDTSLIPVEPDKFVARWPDRSLNADAYVIFHAREDRIVGMKMEAVSSTTDFSFDFHDLSFVKSD